jgi:hypothetical protein
MIEARETTRQEPPMSIPRLLLVLLTACLLPGCGSKLPPGARPTKKTTVTVAYKGQPVEGAVVTFADQSAEPANANGVTDAQGKAVMKTYVDGDGAVVGTHKVYISKSVAEGGQTVDVDDPKYDPNAPPPTIKYLIPQRYSTPAGGLTAEVKESGTNDFTFDLTDK